MDKKMRVRDIVGVLEDRVSPGLLSTTDDVPNLPSANQANKQKVVRQTVNQTNTRPTPALSAALAPTLMAQRRARSRRINELTRPETRVDAAAMLGQAGYEKLGATGTFGSAHAKPDDTYVLKLFSPSDVGYLEFVKLCHAVQSPHLPVFKGQPVKVNSNYWGIRVERLKPLTAAYVKLIEQCKGYLGALHRLPQWQQQAEEGVRGAADVQKVKTQIDQFRITNPSIFPVIDAIYTHIIAKNEELYMPDINMFNVGLRGTTIVFFDPVSTVSEDQPAFLDEEFGPTDDELQRIERGKRLKPDRRIRQAKGMIAPGNTSTYPAL